MSRVEPGYQERLDQSARDKGNNLNLARSKNIQSSGQTSGRSPIRYLALPFSAIENLSPAVQQSLGMCNVDAGVFVQGYGDKGGPVQTDGKKMYTSGTDENYGPLTGVEVTVSTKGQPKGSLVTRESGVGYDSRGRQFIKIAEPCDTPGSLTVTWKAGPTQESRSVKVPSGTSQTEELMLSLRTKPAVVKPGREPRGVLAERTPAPVFPPGQAPGSRPTETRIPATQTPDSKGGLSPAQREEAAAIAKTAVAEVAPKTSPASPSPEAARATPSLTPTPSGASPAVCDVDSASFDRAQAAEGQTVAIKVIGKGECDTQLVTAFLVEQDLIDNDEKVDALIDAARFKGNAAEIRFLAVYQDDGVGGGNPEYTAQVFLVAKPSKTVETSNQLEVSQTPVAESGGLLSSILGIGLPLVVVGAAATGISSVVSHRIRGTWRPYPFR